MHARHNLPRTHDAGHVDYSASRTDVKALSPSLSTFSLNALPDGTQGRSRRHQQADGAASSRVHRRNVYRRARVAFPSEYTATGAQLLATGPGLPVRTPATVRARGALSTRVSATARTRTGAGSPCCSESRVAFAAWGSQRQFAMPATQSAPTFRENSGIGRMPADGGGGSHRRSRQSTRSP